MRSVALSTWSEWSGGLRTSSLSVSVVDPARPWRDQTALFRRVTLTWRRWGGTRMLSTCQFELKAAQCLWPITVANISLGAGVLVASRCSAVHD